MARTKEREEVRPRLRESRSASVLTSHTSQARTAFPQPAGSSLSSLITSSLQTVLAAASLPHAASTALHTTARPQGPAAAQAEGANAGRKCKGTWELCLGCFCLISLSQPNHCNPQMSKFLNLSLQSQPTAHSPAVATSSQCRAAPWGYADTKSFLSILASISSTTKNLRGRMIFHIMKPQQFLSRSRATRCCQAQMRRQSPNWFGKGAPSCSWRRSSQSRVKSSCPCSTWSTSKHTGAVPKASFSSSKIS